MNRVILRCAGHTFTLDRGHTARLGRHVNNDWTVPQRSLSRVHARLSWPADAPRPVLQDLGSQNGTRVDGVASDWELGLSNGAVVELGSVTFHVELTTVATTNSGRGLLRQAEREGWTGLLRVRLERETIPLRLVWGEVVLGAGSETLMALARISAAAAVGHRFEPGPAPSQCVMRRIRPSVALGTGELAWAG